MQNSAWTSRGISTDERTSAAPSSTAPAEVTHEWSGCGDRKKTSVGIDVWLSSISTNQVSQAFQTSIRRSIRSSAWYRQIISAPEGGDPALTSRAVTAASRLENAL